MTARAVDYKGYAVVTEARGRVRVEDGHKRVRTYLGGELVADTIRAKLVWEVPYYPAYYIPEQDVRMELLSPTDRRERSPSRGEAQAFLAVTMIGSAPSLCQGATFPLTYGGSAVKP